MSSGLLIGFGDFSGGPKIRNYKRAFPANLAKVVIERWNSIVLAGDYQIPECPPRPLLNELFEVAYLTASAPEEERYPRFNVVATPPSTSEQSGWIGHTWPFESARELSVAEFRRLAPAVDIKKSAIWVEWSDSSWKIRGLVDLGTSWDRAKVGLEYRYHYPASLLVQVERPGRMAVYQGQFHVATLTDGTIQRGQGGDPHLSLHRLAHSGLAKIEDELIRPKTQQTRRFMEFEFMAFWNTFAAIANSISLGRHGGAVIITGALDIAEAIRTKYKQSASRLRPAFTEFVNSGHALHNLLEGAERGKRISDGKIALERVQRSPILSGIHG